MNCLDSLYGRHSMGFPMVSVYRSHDGREYKVEHLQGFLQPESIRVTNEAGDVGFKNVSGGDVAGATREAVGQADAATFDKRRKGGKH